MGFIPMEDALLPNAPINAFEIAPKETNPSSFSSFEVAHLAMDQNTTPTGMKEEIVLLSWLMVLLRSREDSQISYDWSYVGGTDGIKPEAVNKLSMNEVMKGLQSNVGEVATAISQNLPTGASTGASIILSTSALSRTSEVVKDEVSVGLIMSIESLLTVIERALFIWKFASLIPISRFARCGKQRTCCRTQ
jgi:hypothetical protein